MTYTPSPVPNRNPILPRTADAQFYAQWAVRRIGAALALGIIAPFVIYLTGAFVAQDSDALIIAFVLVGTACPAIAILSLCFARAPR